MFYTYFHTRNDTNKVFYIGKGKHSRLYAHRKRNPYWQNIVNKHGFTAHFAAHWATEEEAFEHEKFLIACFKDLGFELANMTEGGDGVRGFKATKDQIEANRQRAILQMTCKMRALLKKKALENATQEARLSASFRAKETWANSDFADKYKASALRRWADPEERKKQSERIKKYSADPEVRKRLSQQALNKKNSFEARAKISAANKGKIVSEETKAKMRAAWVARKAKKSLTSIFKGVNDG